jgi:predicted unusual protein kinase regulating ubiquinone biosynthesis (AarF/ABC1/UbiB family)
MKPLLGHLWSSFSPDQQQLLSEKVLQPVLDSLPPQFAEQPELLAALATSTATTIAASVYIQSLASFKSNTKPISSDPNLPGPYPSGSYDPFTAKDYFANQPLRVAARAAEIALKASGFLSLILMDYLRGALFDPDQERQRAEQAARLLTSLGPTFIKVGQSLSIRTDLLRPAYVLGLTTLQDKVPPFPTPRAIQLIEAELGCPVTEVFEGGIDPSLQVVAAASLGQVYKLRLKGSGTDVAVKVQRPDIVQQVALDMHILRSIAPIAKELAGLQSDLEGLCDDWGRGFVDELDYRKEADNAAIFMESIASTPLAPVVFAPTAVPQASSRAVLTTEWVEGQRLERATQDGVAAICAIAMNTYLTMMLETGVLHSDPHPGNLLFTQDARLCILDWGLVTRLDDDLQLNFIEHIAHLTSKDYAKVRVWHLGVLLFFLFFFFFPCPLLHY